MDKVLSYESYTISVKQCFEGWILALIPVCDGILEVVILGQTSSAHALYFLAELQTGFDRGFMYLQVCCRGGRVPVLKLWALV